MYGIQGDRARYKTDYTMFGIRKDHSAVVKVRPDLHML